MNPEEAERINGKIADQIIIGTLSSVVAFPAPLITGPDMDKFRWLSGILTATLVTFYLNPDTLPWSWSSFGSCTSVHCSCTHSDVNVSGSVANFSSAVFHPALGLPAPLFP